MSLTPKGRFVKTILDLIPLTEAGFSLILVGTMNKSLNFILAVVIFFLGAPDARSAATAPENSKALRDRFNAAQKAKNVDELLSLIYWKDVPDSIREKMRQMFSRITESTVAEIRFEAGAHDERLEYTQENIRYIPNLKTVGELQVQIKGATNYFGLPVGMLDGRYYIVSAVPVGAPPPRAPAKTAAPPPVPAPKPAAPPAAKGAVGGGGLSDTDLIAKYRQAHEAKNAQDMLLLFDLESFNSEERERLVKILQDSLALEITAAELHPGAAGNSSVHIRLPGNIMIYQTIGKSGRRYLKATLPPAPKRAQENKQTSTAPILPETRSGETDGDVHVAGFVSYFKGSLTLNGGKTCLFSGEQENFGCPSFFDQIRYGRNSIEVQYEPLAGADKNPAKLEVQIFKFIKDKGGREELYAWKAPAPKPGKDTFDFSVDR